MVIQSGNIDAEAPPHWAQQMIDSLETLRNKNEVIHSLLVTDLSDMKANISEMKADVRTLREDITTVRIDVKSLREAVGEMKLEMATVSRFINTLHIERATQHNMRLPRPENLQQVPGPHGTLPWNASIQGPNGEEIVLPPLVSLDAVQALEASQLEAYLQVYYPGLAVPEDLTERKRKVLRAIGRSRESYEI